MNVINNVHLKGKVVNVSKRGKDGYIKLLVATGKRHNKVIPVNVCYTTSREKRGYLSFLKEGKYISINGYLDLKYNNYTDSNENFVIANKCLAIPTNAYENFFDGEVTGINGIHQNDNGYGICFNMHIKTERSITLQAIAYGKEAKKILNLQKKKGKVFVKGNITMNKYNKMIIKVDSFYCG